MKNNLMKGLLAGVAMIFTANTVAAETSGEITVAYFLEWPLPMLAAKASGCLLYTSRCV